MGRGREGPWRAGHGGQSTEQRGHVGSHGVGGLNSEHCPVRMRMRSMVGKAWVWEGWRERGRGGELMSGQLGSHGVVGYRLEQ